MCGVGALVGDVQCNFSFKVNYLSKRASSKPKSQCEIASDNVPRSVGEFDSQFAHGTDDGEQALDSVGVNN